MSKDKKKKKNINKIIELLGSYRNYRGNLAIIESESRSSVYAN